MNTITKAERAARIKHAQALLLAAGCPRMSDAAGGEIDAQLMREFNLADKRTATALRVRALRGLRDETLPRIGRPAEHPAPMRTGDCAEVVTIGELGEIIGATRYNVSAEQDGAMRLSAKNADTLIVRRVTE